MIRLIITANTGARVLDYNCLIVDDEQALAQSTCEYFNLFDVKAAYVGSADECLDFLRENRAEVILLDINLPGKLPESSGFALCKRLRQMSDTPILFISARTSDDDQILALGIGGDDYIQKPYSLSVLLAKVRAVLKRRRAGAAPAQGEHFTFGGLDVDFAAGRATKNGEPLGLKTMEFKLLSYLIHNSGRIVSKEELFRNVWEDSFTGDGTLNVHIRRLREKIEDDPKKPRIIKTVWGTGYRFDSD